MPAVVTVMEGINLPRYPSVPGRMRAKRKPIAASEPAKPDAKLKLVRLVLPATSGKQVEILGSGADAAPKVVEILQEIGVALMSTLVFVESAEDELSQQAVVMAASLGEDVTAVAIDGGGSGFAPAAWAQTLVDHAACDRRERDHRAGERSRQRGDGARRRQARSADVGQLHDDRPRFTRGR